MNDIQGPRTGTHKDPCHVTPYQDVSTDLEVNLHRPDIRAVDPHHAMAISPDTTPDVRTDQGPIDTPVLDTAAVLVILGTAQILAIAPIVGTGPVLGTV